MQTIKIRLSSSSPLSPGNSVRVERAEALHQRRGVARPELRRLRGHRPVAEGRGRRRRLRGRAARLPHLLFLEEKQEVRDGKPANLLLVHG